MKNLKVLIVEDSVIFSEGLRLILEQHASINKVYLAHNFNDTLDILIAASIDVIFLDLNFETSDYDGFIIAKKIKELYSDIKIIVLTQHARIYIYEKLFNECKVDAYLDKQLGAEDMFFAIEQVINNEKYVDRNISEILEIEQWLKISKREGEVILLLMDGLVQKEIAFKLNISPKTVEKHIFNLMKKFKVKNSVELITKYMRYINGNRENLAGEISFP
ncbi:response regulator transcription factor [Flavivirga sp. 57AJ16]|uniref:response regulator transcription factor n=1 Tax=Flavivirga sp. 57AJ16 TaxID=3025307 RepID=UPI0023653B3F|nr:response regulator transcription factor [Flavivirga sp. 57AJ16]MDD7887118.1 response regulator transcription factor [Flavivirga sp. 57AJ16]